MSVEVSPIQRSLTGRGAQLQGDERYRLQRIVILERHHAFQQQRPLRFSIRYGDMARITTHFVIRARALRRSNNKRRAPEG